MPQVALWGKGILCKKSAENTNYTTHAWLYRLLSAEIALAHISCGFEGNEVVDDKGNPIDLDAEVSSVDDQESEGNRLIKLANRMINIDKLTINLIDSINPFQRAYEVLSKQIDKTTLKVIQDTMAEQKFDLTLEQAMVLFKGPYKQYVAEHNGLRPDIKDPDPKVRELAAAFQKLKNLKLRKMMGLEYEPENK